MFGSPILADLNYAFELSYLMLMRNFFFTFCFNTKLRNTRLFSIWGSITFLPFITLQISPLKPRTFLDYHYTIYSIISEMILLPNTKVGGFAPITGSHSDFSTANFWSIRSWAPFTSLSITSPAGRISVMRHTPSPAYIAMLSMSPVVVTFGTVPAKRWISFSCWKGKCRREKKC